MMRRVVLGITMLVTLFVVPAFAQSPQQYQPGTQYFAPSVAMNQQQLNALLTKVAPRPTVYKTVVQEYKPSEAQVRQDQQFRDKSDFAFWGLIVLLVCGISGLFWALALRLVPQSGTSAPATIINPVVIRPEVIRVTDHERTFIAIPEAREEKKASGQTPPVGDK